MNGKAKKGGQTGINGQQYKGGQFLPASKNTVKGQMPTWKAKASSKRRSGLTEPGKVEQLPPGKRAIFGTIRAFVQFENGTMAITASDHSLSAYGYTRDAMQALVDQYNTGERLFAAPDHNESDNV
ncbi:hypothetical protein ACINJM_004227 [Cronobacter sakazakii]|uniref:hypothetical protein n=1 Tax=Cronobacter sakazakii TaxID=28141 RepID=UPI0009BAF8C2|nr:hypothetical protein [Cronobacter sakazakii]MCZ6132266.1 hypothetical protein [Cronobacter sakazakii]MCZ6139947.1 hypothetical protein [Cronobacter sakazakii]PUX78741.1 hypothetical protein BTK64_22555 [Cronobacter sakazakii]RRA25400.1 hypothetical protein C3O71_22425 [Cronobacter sakazakii]RRA42327.1 hypothetical protein C3O73_19750 [Cronobacter sakazakii]